MKFTNYTTAKDFSDDVLSVLNRHEIQNNLFYKNIGNGKLMVSVKDDGGEIMLVAARTSPLPMVLYEANNVRNERAVAFLARSLVENDIDIDFIMTEKELAKSFCKHYGKLTGKKHHNNKNLVLYVLEKINELVPVSGLFRKVSADDMFYLPYWYADFAPACHIGDYNLSAGMDGANQAIENGSAYVWVDNYPVSLAASIRGTSNCAFIGKVYTPPNLRGKGYSTACVWRLSQKLLGEGFPYCALYADCDNPYSNKVYQKIGYNEVLKYEQYRLFKED